VNRNSTTELNYETYFCAKHTSKNTRAKQQTNMRKHILVFTLSLLFLLSFSLCFLHNDEKHTATTSNLDTIQLRRSIIQDKDITDKVLSSPSQTWSLHHSKFFGQNDRQGQSNDSAEKHSFLIKFNPETTQLTDEFKSQFHQSYGVNLDYYIPHFSFLVQATLQQADRIVTDSSQNQVRFMIDYHPELKTAHDLSSEEALESALAHRITSRKAQEQERLTTQLDKAHTSQESSNLTAEQLHKKRLQELEEEKQRVPLAVHIFKSSNADLVLQEMKNALMKQGIDVHVIMKASSEKIVASLPFKSVIQAVEILAHHSAVHWIDLLNFASFKDNKTNRWVVQSNMVSRSPYTDRGITGKNQVIGYGDSGLDVYNCFFYDDKNAVPFTNATVPLVQTGHRKIAGYLAYMDGLDDIHGHGTHVGGTLAGSSLNPNSPSGAYNGIANHAKIAFMDIGCSKEGGCQCTHLAGCPCDLMKDQTCPSGDELFMPLDLNEGYFPFSYQQGARIHSNSIGGVIGDGYGIESREIDTFMHEHDDFLIVWSAGNSGRNDGLMTLTGPLKQAKNALIVAAGTSAFEGWQDVMANFRDYNDKAKAYRAPLWQKNFCDCNTTCKMDICDSIKDLDTEEGCCKYLDNCAIPMPEESTNPLASVNNMCCKKCALDNLEKKGTAKFYQVNNLASFSSLGPAMDGRIKPDVTAPGFYVLSAKSHGSDPSMKCSADNQDNLIFQIQPMAGTSMATPTAASTATLVRDYFESGFYPTGEQEEKNKLKPSAALVKAVMIDCAKPMTGIARWRVEGSSIHLIQFSDLKPNQRRYFEGFGLLNLANTLFLNGATLNKLFVKDRASISTGYVHHYDLEIKQQGNVTVTLVWTDYPASPASSVALVNDLDLEVSFGNSILLGNSLDESTSVIPDRLNNVEKVVIPSIEANTKLRVSVKGHHIPNGPQQYALVISGQGVEHDNVKFKEAKIEPNQPSTPKHHITMPVGLFVFLVGGEGLLIAALVIALTIFLIRKSKNSYETI